MTPGDTHRIVERCYDSLAAFSWVATGGLWRPSELHHKLCAALESVERGEVRRLIVCMPPRHGKSMVSSQLFPVWALGKNPHRDIIIAAHTADLAQDFSRAAREYMRVVGGALFGTTLSKESKAVSRWALQRPARGGVIAAGVGGPITGRGANIAIIDDPIKNMVEARSQAYRDHLWDWYRSTLRPRLAPGGSIVVVMTRWHADDLVGRLLSAAKVGGEKWEVLSFPALGDGNRPLWPEWFHFGELDDIRKSVGPYVWEAQFQQRPQSDLAGAMWSVKLIDPFRSPVPSEVDRIIVVIDPAGRDSIENAETGIIVGGVVGKGLNARCYILDDLSGHYTPAEWGRKSVSAYHAYKADAIYGETNFGGDMVESTVKGVDPLVPFRRINATRGKQLRAEPVVALYEQGRVHHTRLFPELEIQMCNWDGRGRSPDRLDAMVHAVTELMLSAGAMRSQDRSVDIMAELLGSR